MNFADVLLYFLGLLALFIMGGALCFGVLALHDGSLPELARSIACIVIGGILWVLTKIAERLDHA
jgi:hypothetical protein